MRRGLQGGVGGAEACVLDDGPMRGGEGGEVVLVRTDDDDDFEISCLDFISSFSPTSVLVSRNGAPIPSPGTCSTKPLPQQT